MSNQQYDQMKALISYRLIKYLAKAFRKPHVESGEICSAGREPERALGFEINYFILNLDKTHFSSKSILRMAGGHPAYV